jgi:hypothetical protein
MSKIRPMRKKSGHQFVLEWRNRQSATNASGDGSNGVDRQRASSTLGALMLMSACQRRTVLSGIGPRLPNQGRKQTSRARISGSTTPCPVARTRLLLSPFCVLYRAQFVKAFCHRTEHFLCTKLGSPKGSRTEAHTGLDAGNLRAARALQRIAVQCPQSRAVHAEMGALPDSGVRRSLGAKIRLTRHVDVPHAPGSSPAGRHTEGRALFPSCA